MSEVLSLCIGFQSIAQSKSTERKLRLSISSTCNSFLHLVLAVNLPFHADIVQLSRHQNQLTFFFSERLENLKDPSFLSCVECVYAPSVDRRGGHLGNILLDKIGALCAQDLVTGRQTRNIHCILYVYYTVYIIHKTRIKDTHQHLYLRFTLQTSQNAPRLLLLQGPRRNLRFFL